MKDTYISDSVVYVGVDDKTIDLFESQYVVPNGVSYNSYVILDDKIAIMDTVDPRATDEWLGNVEKALGRPQARLPGDPAPGAGPCRQHRSPGQQVSGDAVCLQPQALWYDGPVL